MATTFPTTVDTFTDPISGDYQNSATVPHHTQHANLNDAVAAIQTVVFGIRNDLAASVVVPGATSWALRNSANTRNSLLITDAGAATFSPQTNSVIVSTSVPTDRAIVNNTPLVVNQYGVGIGFTPQIGLLSVLGLDTTYTDPASEVLGIRQSTTVTLTANNNAICETINPSAYLNDGGHNQTREFGSILSETHIKSTSSGTHTLLYGGSTSAWLDAGSSASAAEMFGGQGYVNVAGSGTVTIAKGLRAIVSLNASGGVADGNITLACGLWANVYNLTSAATPGQIATLEGIRVTSPVYSATAISPTVRGLIVFGQTNTNGGTATTGGYTADGVYIILGAQGGNTSGTNTNHALYITGDGGTPGAGGAVNNWAIRSDSLAPSFLAGALTLAGGATVSATGLALSAGNLVVGSGLPTDAGRMIYLHGTSTSGVSQFGLAGNMTFGSDATTGGTVVYTQLRTAAAAFTMVTGWGIHVDVPTVGAASAITTGYGIQVENQGNAGITTSHGLRIADQSGSATNWAFRSGAGKFLFGSSAATIGFYGAGDIAQAILATGTGKTVDNVITALQNLGLVKQS